MFASSTSHVLPEELLLRSQYNITSDEQKTETKNPLNTSERATKINFMASYRWNENMRKPYPQCIQHELVIDFWARNIQLFQNHNIAGSLIHVITCYSVPAFKFRYGNETKISIYNDGLICKQLLKTKCSVLFGPRIKYDGLDSNMIYKFTFRMVSGNIGIGICSNDYVHWNTLLHSVHHLRSSIIWKNGYYLYNKLGNNDRKSIQSSHIDDIFEDGDDVELEVNLVNLTCFVRNVTNRKAPRHELPIRHLVKYKGSTGYMQIVIGFFDDFGAGSWVKGSAIMQIMDQRGEYVKPQKSSVQQPQF